MKSPVRRIHKVKTAKVVKDTYTDEALELSLIHIYADHKGTQLNYEVLSEAVSAVRCSVPLGTLFLI